MDSEALVEIAIQVLSDYIHGQVKSKELEEVIEKAYNVLIERYLNIKDNGS